MAEAPAHNPLSPLRVVDRLNEIRSFAECAFMAASHIPDPEERNTLQPS
jgi:hypothetical protein